MALVHIHYKNSSRDFTATSTEIPAPARQKNVIMAMKECKIFNYTVTAEADGLEMYAEVTSIILFLIINSEEI